MWTAWELIVINLTEHFLIFVLLFVVLYLLKKNLICGFERVDCYFFLHYLCSFKHSSLTLNIFYLNVLICYFYSYFNLSDYILFHLAVYNIYIKFCAKSFVKCDLPKRNFRNLLESNLVFFKLTAVVCVNVF